MVTMTAIRVPRWTYGAVQLDAFHPGYFIRQGGYRVGEYLAQAAITVLMGGVAIRTVLAVARRRLMPRPAPAGTGTVFAGRSLP
jgi:tellurite resistance protein